MQRLGRHISSNRQVGRQRRREGRDFDSQQVHGGFCQQANAHSVAVSVLGGLLDVPLEGGLQGVSDADCKQGGDLC